VCGPAPWGAQVTRGGIRARNKPLNTRTLATGGEGTRRSEQRSKPLATTRHSDHSTGKARWCVGRSLAGRAQAAPAATNDQIEPLCKIGKNSKNARVDTRDKERDDGVRVVARWMSGVGATDRGGGGREGALTSHDHTDHKASVRHVRTVRS
jgi:hypothetical protein